jgi:hypothetical protein
LQQIENAVSPRPRRANLRGRRCAAGRAGTQANCFGGHRGQEIRHFLGPLGEAIPGGLAQTKRPVYRREEAEVRRKARGVTARRPQDCTGSLWAKNISYT